MTHAQGQHAQGQRAQGQHAQGHMARDTHWSAPPGLITHYIVGRATSRGFCFDDKSAWMLPVSSVAVCPDPGQWCDMNRDLKTNISSNKDWKSKIVRADVESCTPDPFALPKGEESHAESNGDNQNSWNNKNSNGQITFQHIVAPFWKLRYLFRTNSEPSALSEPCLGNGTLAPCHQCPARSSAPFTRKKKVNTFYGKWGSQISKTYETLIFRISLT